MAGTGNNIVLGFSADGASTNLNLYDKRYAYFRFGGSELSFITMVGDRHVYTVGKQCEVDGVQVGQLVPKSETGPADSTVFVFASNSGGAPSYYAAAKVYGVRVYDGDVLIADFIPCMRESDGALGMYDRLRSACSETGTPFYIKKGPGAFVAGPSV